MQGVRQAVSFIVRGTKEGMEPDDLLCSRNARSRTPLGDRATTRRTRAGSAAVAVVARRDLAVIELCRIKVPDMSWRTMAHRQVEHLVEVAVVERAVPTN